MTFSDLNKWIVAYPLLGDIISLKPVIWLNANREKIRNIHSLPVTLQDLQDAAELWERFAPYLSKAFPETIKTGGIIESPLKEIPQMQLLLNKQKGISIPGKLLLKCDNE